jgi:hypothetical protein
MQENQFSAGRIKGKEHSGKDSKYCKALKLAHPSSNLNSIPAN